MAVKLHKAGCFFWREWAEHLAAEIMRAYDLAIPHIRIFEAIERRDPETAALVMRQHLQDLMRCLPSSCRR